MPQQTDYKECNLLKMLDQRRLSKIETKVDIEEMRNQYLNDYNYQMAQLKNA